MSLFASFFFDSISPTASSNFTRSDCPADDVADANDPQAAMNSDALLATESFAQEMSVQSLRTYAIAGSEDDASDAGQTILSSAPSEAILNIDRVGRTDTNLWPETQIASARHPLSVSTEASCYIELDNESNVGPLPRHDSFASLSFHASVADGSITTLASLQSSGRNNEQSVAPPHLIHSNTTRSTASFRSLTYCDSSRPLQSTTTVWSHCNRNTMDPRRAEDWYAQFNQSDWEGLHVRAQMAVRTLDLNPGVKLRLYPLPPSPPRLPSCIQDSALAHPALSLQEIGVPGSLPDCFVCPICNSAIVGALTMDCDCATTVCSACWEYRSAKQDPRFALARDLDYAIVDTPQASVEHKCPRCRGRVRNPIPCPALDVAMLRLVQGLGADFRQFQDLYYERLGCWREEVMRRHEEPTGDSGCLSDEVIAGLIQEEERLWNRAKVRASSTCSWVPGAFGFFVAFVASVGFQVLARRHGEGRFGRIGCGN